MSLIWIMPKKAEKLTKDSTAKARKKMTNNNLTMLVLFAGAGGLSEGLSEAGFHSLFASEIMPIYAQTYKKNHPSAKVLTADVHISGAACYGVPQMHWRTIILGMLGNSLPTLAFLEPIYRAPIKPNFTTTFDGHLLVKIPAPEASVRFVTVQEAIGNLPLLKCGERSAVVKDYACEPACDYQRRARIGNPGIYNHEAPRLSKENQERLKYIKPDGNWTNIPNDLLPCGVKRTRKSDHTKRYGPLLQMDINYFNKVQETFFSMNLPDGNVYRNAIRHSLYGSDA